MSKSDPSELVFAVTNRLGVFGVRKALHTLARYLTTVTFKFICLGRKHTHHGHSVHMRCSDLIQRGTILHNSCIPNCHHSSQIPHCPQLPPRTSFVRTFLRVQRYIPRARRAAARKTAQSARQRRMLHSIVSESVNGASVGPRPSTASPCPKNKHDPKCCKADFSIIAWPGAGRL